MVVFFSILYKPTANAIDNIIVAKSLGFKPVVYLNSVDFSQLDSLKKLEVVLLGENKNVGVGLAFFEFEIYMNSLGLDYFIYFDQDTIVMRKAWCRVLETYEMLYSKPSVGLLYYNMHSNVFPKVAVNSGCLFSMRVLQDVGFHDKSYFVEGVDYEFCLRLKRNGYIIVGSTCDGVDHKSLQDGFRLHIFYWKVHLRLYGENRIRDFNKAHKRLISVSLRHKEYWFFLFFIKSFIRMNLMEKFTLFLRR